MLVGKTIEQALIEVLEEEEIAALKEQQRRFLELRMAEKAEEQRLAEEERRRREEKVDFLFWSFNITALWYFKSFIYFLFIIINGKREKNV